MGESWGNGSVAGTVAVAVVAICISLTSCALQEQRPDAGTEPAFGETTGSVAVPVDTETSLLEAPSTAFPDGSSAGVQSDLELLPSGDLSITKEGTVIDGLDVKGSIDVHANDVTIRNTRVATADHQYPIRIRPGVTGALIEYVEVSNEGHPGKAIYFDRASGTVRNANVHSAEDGVFITGDNVTVEASYIHHLVGTATSHSDAIQIRRGSNITIRGNNLQVFNDQTGEGMNAAIQLGSLLGDEPIEDLLVIGNLMNGGNMTVNLGREGDLRTATFSGNRFGRQFRHAVVGHLPEGTVWDGSNVYDDTGETVS